jgi:hypothetical protein
MPGGLKRKSLLVTLAKHQQRQKMITFVSSISALNKMTLLVLYYGDQKGVPEN